MNPRITISIPIYKRPERTARAIACLKAQTMPDFEAIVIGDGDPDYQKAALAIGDDARFITFNTPKNFGGCGYRQTNWAIHQATAPYFCFFANDDVLAPCHLSLYLSQIEGTDLDFVYCNYIAFDKMMKTRLRYGRIGHSALIIRTAFLKQMPPHGPEYGHDYDLIRDMKKAGAKYKKAKGIPPTYYVMSGNKRREDPEGID